MAFAGTERYGIDAAPGGIAVVQDLLNTTSASRVDPTPDLLVDLAHARPWADTLSRAVGIAPKRITARDLARLHALREALRDAIHRRDGRADSTPDAFEAAVALRLDADGTVHGNGPGLIEVVLLQVFAAQARADWPRLKLCALDSCDLAFYDRTRNTSARFHTPRCANFVNLHNSRERRRRDAARS